VRNRNSWSFSLTAALLLMCPFDLIASLGMDMYLPAIPDMPGLLGTTASRIQLTLSTYMLVIGAGQLIFGPLSDRYGRRPVLLGGSALFTLSSLGLAWTREVWLFLLLRLVEGAGGAAMLVATFATVRDVYADRKEGSVIYGLMGAMLAFVPALGPLLGAVLYAQGSLGAVFSTLAVLAGIAGLRALVSWPETRPADSHAVDFARIGGVLRHRELWSYTLANAVGMGTFFVYFSITPAILVFRHGYSPLEFSLMFATVALVLIATSRFVGRVVEQRGRHTCLGYGMAFLLAGAVLLLLSETLQRSAIGFMFPIWIMGIGIATTVAVAANGALAPFPKIAGTATALFYCVSSLTLVSAGTLAVVLFPPQSAWPLVTYAGLGSLLVLVLRTPRSPDGAPRVG
jgi:DHA1 family florfenicol/chloramphenicol resistance protein-like MFS transporter